MVPLYPICILMFYNNFLFHCGSALRDQRRTPSKILFNRAGKRKRDEWDRMERESRFFRLKHQKEWPSKAVSQPPIPVNGAIWE